MDREYKMGKTTSKQYQRQYQDERFMVHEHHLQQVTEYIDNVLDQTKHYANQRSEDAKRHQLRFLKSALSTVQTAVICLDVCSNHEKIPRINKRLQDE